MPKPASAPPSPARLTGSLWPAFVLVALTSAAAGALGMWTWTQAHPPARPAVAPTPAAAALNPALQDTLEPPAELTAGRPPAEAARLRGDYFYDQQKWVRAVAEYEVAIQQG